MPYETVNRDFVLSDSSVNAYGYRLLTSGYQLEEFAKNPIGYYGHDKKDGVLVKWENLRIEGDKVLATPTINLDHPRGARTVNEIKDGFLNAASVGRNVFVEADLEDNPSDKDDPILVGLKWYNKEASLVDAGANRGALAVDLEDVDGKQIDLKEIKSKFFNNNSMKTVTLPLNAELKKILNLGDEETAEAVEQGIKALHEDNEQLRTDKGELEGKVAKAEKDLSDEREAISSEKVKGALDKAIGAGKISAATRAKLEKQYAGKPKDLEDLLESMPVYQKIAQSLNAAGEIPKDLADMDWDAADKADKLTMIKRDFPAHYDALKEKKFGK